MLFHVDKIRLSREMAINLQSSAARSVRSLADSKSMKNSSLRYFFNRVRLTHFDVGVRKLMFKWQACSHRIVTAHINRISSAIYLEDVALMRETAIHRNASFHGDTPSISSETLCARRDTVCSAGISRRSRVRVKFVLIWLRLAQRRGICVVVAGLPQIGSLKTI